MTYRFRAQHEITYWLDGESNWQREAVEALWWSLSKRWRVRFLPEPHRPNVRIDYDPRPKSEIGALGWAYPLRGGRTRVQIASDVDTARHTHDWIVGHELGHHLGADHQPRGLMSVNSPEDWGDPWADVDVAAWSEAFGPATAEWRREGAEKRLRRAHGPWETARALYLRYLDRQPALSGLGWWGNHILAGRNVEPQFRAKSVWPEDEQV